MEHLILSKTLTILSSVAISRSKNDETVERIRTVARMDDFNRQDDFSTSRRYLIVLYLASVHTLFKEVGERKKNDKKNLRYFSGPKLLFVARRISKEWKMSNNQIKFDRSRTTILKYEKYENEGYVKSWTKGRKFRLFALTKKGFDNCEKIVNSLYRSSSRNLSKVRVIAINNHLNNTYFLALKEDGTYVLGTANNNLNNEGITENSLIEYEQNEVVDYFGELLFKSRIERVSKDSLRILSDDGSIPRIKDMPHTDIKDINAESELYYIRGKIVSRWSPEDEEGIEIKEIGDTDTGVVKIQDSTGNISYIKIPYDSRWPVETIRIDTWVEAIGIYKSRLYIGEDSISTSLFAPYKVEFFRPFRHSPKIAREKIEKR